MKKELVKREIEKTCAYYSTNEWVSINGDLKNKIIEVKHNTRRKRKPTTNVFVTQTQIKKTIEILYAKTVLKTYHYLR